MRKASKQYQKDFQRFVIYGDINLFYWIALYVENGERYTYLHIYRKIILNEKKRKSIKPF